MHTWLKNPLSPGKQVLSLTPLDMYKKYYTVPITSFSTFSLLDIFLKDKWGSLSSPSDQGPENLFD